jgi:1-acyl-sn-glycerol-3-phosphate acyltransferase
MSIHAPAVFLLADGANVGGSPLAYDSRPDPDSKFLGPVHRIAPAMPTAHQSPIDAKYSPRFARGFGRGMSAISRIWFRYGFRHAERIPRGKVLFVGNHSGIGIADVLCMVGAATTALPEGRRCVGMMHKAFIDTPIVGTIASGFGAVPADPASAKEAFARGHDVICFPGGDLDATRPFYEARRVHFGKRRGYVRLALEQNVPIVPLATIGAHYTYVLLPGGAWIARVTRMKKWARCERFPLVLGTVLALGVLALTLALALPWWVAAIAGLAALVPNPVRITTEVLPAIDVAAQTAHIEDPTERIEAAHALVHGALERAVATMTHASDAASTRQPGLALAP